MNEATFQLITSSCFALSFALVFALQSAAPCRRAARLLPGNWRQNVPLAVLNTTITSLACGEPLRGGALLGWAPGPAGVRPSR